MEKIELQDIIDVCVESESEYIKLYRPLLGYEDNVELYRGIDDSLEETLNEIENMTGIAFPADFLQVYLLSNGGKYFDVNLYPLLASRTDPNGLYAKNIDRRLREDNNIANDMLVIGETTDGLYILVGIDEEGYYYYCTWDKETKTLDAEFDSLVEILVYEIDYHTQAFSVEGEVLENQDEE